MICAGNDILDVVAWPLVLDDIAKSFAIARRTTRVRVEHDVSASGKHLEVVHESQAVHSVRAAVHRDDQRILARCGKSRRLQYPALDLLSIRRGVPNFLRRS